MGRSPSRRSSAAWPAARQGGFALVVALALMAFLVLLVVSLATIGRVDSEIIRSQRSLAQAQANALFALDLALGQLQEIAGPDQRVTARAEIDQSVRGPEQHWVAVWDSLNTLGDSELLVSQNDSLESRWVGLDPSLIQRIPSVEDLGVWLRLSGYEHASGESVYAPLAPLVDSSSTSPTASATLGRFAYLTEDESLKASISAIDIVDQIGGEALSAGMTTSLIRQRSASGIGLKEVRENFAGNTDDLYPSILTFDLPVALSFVSPQLAQVDSDLGYGALGLLTNPIEGGLKLNLSAGDLGNPFDDSFGDGAALTVWNQYPSPRIVRTKDHGDQLSIAPLTVSSDVYEALEAGQPYAHVGPLMPEAALYVAVYERNNEPSVRYIYDVEVWNPYPFTLAFPGNDTRSMTVWATGLPVLELQSSNGGYTGPMPMDSMPRSNVNGPAETSSWLQLSERAGSSNYSGIGALLPGEVYRLKDPDPDEKPDGLWKVPQGTLGTVPATYSISLIGSPPDDTGVSFFLNSGSALDEGAVFFEVQGIDFESFQYQFTSNSFPPYKGIDFSVDVEDMFIFALHYRFGARWDDASMAQILSATDLRRPTFSLAEDAFINVSSRNPVETNSGLTGIFAGTDLFYDDFERGSERDEYADIRLYDYPLGVPISVADFRALPFKGLPSRVLGRPSVQEEFGVELNKSFDRYILTGLPSGWIPQKPYAEQILPQSRLFIRTNEGLTEDELGAALQTANAAEHLLLRGAFNWNSTSVNAWKAVLARAFDIEHPWVYEGLDGSPQQWPETDEPEEGPPIFRRSSTADRQTEAWSDQDFEDAGWGSDDVRQELFRQGVRFPNADWVDLLAQAIVDRIRETGTPFGSLSELVERGVFADAIQAIGLNQNGGSPSDGFLPIAPTHLEQSDLVALLASSGTIRGDTFTIRTYGDVVNPFTAQVEGRAWVEAKVQRIYDYLDPDLDSTAPGVEANGAPRAFQIVSFRWLGSDLN